MNAGVETIDLLMPSEVILRLNYLHQLRSTIAAYSPTMIVIGEALQNAIDAVCETKRRKGKISAVLDFDRHTVTVTDNGIGFPRDVSLLYLGGTGKHDKGLKGEVGVGIKVTLFSSNWFEVRSNCDDGAWIANIENALYFETLPKVEVPKVFGDDPNPLEHQGTEVAYRFPAESEFQDNPIDEFVAEIFTECIPGEPEEAFLKTAAEYDGFPSVFAALLASYLRRYTYAGDTLATFGAQDRFPGRGIEIEVTVICSNPIERFGEEWGELFGDETTQSFVIEPSYMSITDTLDWVPKGKKKPGEFNYPLGPGGSNLPQHMQGFNVRILTKEEEFVELLRNARNNLPPPKTLEKYSRHLFPNINMIMITIGHIGDLNRFLPGGSRRIISCNGTVTKHEINLIRGRNQLFVRCLDIVVDVNGRLNYGKTQLTSTMLVGLVFDYLNAAYGRTLQSGAQRWVGNIPTGDQYDTEEKFVTRPDLGVPDFITGKVPQDENDVIGLFFELAGNGWFPEYKIFGLSQRATYDGRAAIQREGDDISIFTPEADTDLKTVEFKLHATDVMKDFEQQQKSSREIDLVIAWDEGSYENANYGFHLISESAAADRSPSMVYPRASWVIEDRHEGYEVQVILLREIVGEIISQLSEDQ